MNETFLYERKLNKISDFNVWMAFPERYSFSMSSVGYLWLFKELDEDESINVERITTDTDNTIINPLKVDAIGFSFSFDFDFINIFKILEKYNIPLKTKERNADPSKRYPVIFGGGPVLTANPEPYKEFFDFMVIGDGENVNKKSVHFIKNSPKYKYENENWEVNTAFYDKLAEIDGVYVPFVHNVNNPVKKATAKIDLPLYTPILSNQSFFSDTFIIETSRGCSNCCGFCLASYLNFPVRFVDYKKIIEKIDFGLKYTKKIALLGALVTAHPKFEDICEYIYNKIKGGMPIKMSISSMRANTLTPIVIKTLVAAGQKTVTIAIEAATERLRKVINKNISKEEIYNAIRISKEYGLSGVKLYSMLGLPTETDNDVDAFVQLAKDLKKEFKGFNIAFSFSTFVPKPHTPFQYIPRENTQLLEKKIKKLQKEFHKLGIEASFSSPKWDYYQTLLSRGDSSLSEYLIDVYKNGGKIGAFKSAAKKFDINTDLFVTNEMDKKLNSPWDVVLMNPSKHCLINEKNRLLSYSVDNVD